MNKWLALALAFNSHTSSSLPYWKSEFEGLFIFTPRWRVHVQERSMIHRWRHGAADMNRILIWCVCEIALRLWSRSKQWRGYEPGTLCIVTGPLRKSTETGTIPHPHPPTSLTLAFNAPSKSTNTFPRGFKMCCFLKGGWSNRYALLPQGLETINKQVQGFNPKPFIRVSQM